MQKLQLEIRHITLLKTRGADEISFCVPNDQVLDKVLGKSEARENFPELYFDLKITKGKGEELLSALGLVPDEMIRIPEFKYEFGKSGEKTDE